MDRHRMVRHLEAAAGEGGLGPDEVRLYLLLLAVCDEKGQGRIDCRQLAVVFRGCDDGGRVGRTCARLAAKGLMTGFRVDADPEWGLEFALACAPDWL